MHCQPGYKHQVYIWSKNIQTCLLCDEATETADCVCNVCETELPWLMEHHEICALPLAMDGLVCGQCLKQPPAFKQVIAPWTYSFPVDTLISRFKHQARWPLGHLLGHLLGKYLQHRFDNHELIRPDALLPVPMASQRLRERGYNQALMLARWLSADLTIPCNEHVLLRPHETLAAQNLDAKSRKRNLLNAFAVSTDAQDQDRHFAQVDAVLTTGATPPSLARLLLRAGTRQAGV